MATQTVEPPPASAPAYQATGRGAAAEHVGEEIKPAPRREQLSIVAFFAVAYSLLGYQVVVEQHVVVFDALDRLTRAYLVWHNDPPKLAAVGFEFPPLTSVVFLPFALVKPLATSLVALPVASAVFAALTLGALDRILARCSMRLVFRWPVLLLVAINPLFAFYATNGTSESLYLWLMTFGLYCGLTWFVTRQPRFLVGAGLALALAGLTRYSFVIWALLLGVLIALALRRREAQDDEVEGSVILFIAPVVYAIAVWTLFNALIVGRPLSWITSGDDSAVNAANTAAAADFDAGELLGRLVELLFYAAPAALVCLPVLIFAFVSRRNDFSLWLAVLGLTSIVVMGVDAALEDNLGVLAIGDALPVFVVAVIGLAWLHHELPEQRTVVWILSLAVLVVSLPITWRGMQTYPFQNQEQAFIQAIRTGDDQEATNSIGGYKVGIGPEQRMAAYINRTASRPSSVLTDNARSFAVIVLSGRPQLFFDRIDRGDTEFNQALERTPTTVDYVLVSKTGEADLVRAAFPGILEGRSERASVVFETDRYALARVR